MRIRKAGEADIGAMHRIRSSVRENRLSDPGRVTAASYLPFVRAGCAWVAEAGDRMAGFAALDLASGNVWALFVAPEAEGRGAGRALHRALLDRARAEGLSELRLTTAPGTRAERFYLRAGWESDGPAGDGEVRLRRAVAGQEAMP